MQAHHVDETKQSRQVAGEHEAGYSTVMEVVTRESHAERGGRGMEQEAVAVLVEPRRGRGSPPE